MRVPENYLQKPSIQQPQKKAMHHRSWTTPQQRSDMQWLTDLLINQDVHIIGSGASLWGINWDLFKNQKTLVVNNTIKYYPNPTAHVFLDMPVLKQGGHTPGVPIITKRGNVVPQPAHHIIVSNQFDKTGEKGYYSPFSTAHTCISLALVHGAKRIFLWGLEQMHYDEITALKFHKYVQTSPYYIRKDFIDQWRKIKSKGGYMGHFYSEDIPHQRDKIAKSYINAGDRMAPFKGYPVYQTTPIHNTPFEVKQCTF